MLIAILIGWSVLVFAAYGYCVVNQIDPIFYLWLVFALIGAVFAIMDGLGMILHGNVKADRPKEDVKERRRNAQNFTPFTSLLAYMTIPLIICIVLEYLIF